MSRYPGRVRKSRRADRSFTMLLLTYQVYEHVRV